MTREEAKKLLPILQAFAEGKTIQYRNAHRNWTDTDCIYFSEQEEFGIIDGKEYRIKSESKYRPFKNVEECWNEMLKHQPFGWVTHLYTNFKRPIEAFSNTASTNIKYDGTWYDFNAMFDRYIFADGTPFGIKEEK